MIFFPLVMLAMETTAYCTLSPAPTTRRFDGFSLPQIALSFVIGNGSSVGFPPFQVTLPVIVPPFATLSWPWYWPLGGAVGGVGWVGCAGCVGDAVGTFPGGVGCATGTGFGGSFFLHPATPATAIAAHAKTRFFMWTCSSLWGISPRDERTIIPSDAACQ